MLVPSFNSAYRFKTLQYFNERISLILWANRDFYIAAFRFIIAFADCKTAFLVVQEPLTHPDRMKEVAMTIDFKKESKDKMIWSSYFPRFGNANMHVLYYDYKDAFLKDKWYANMKQLHKLYTDLGITFQPHIIESKSTYQDINALRFAAAQGYGLLIAVTTKEKDGLEFFIGTQEQRTIVNRDAIPILFLNPREDLYVLCD